jgi:hypothetical protein
MNEENRKAVIANLVSARDAINKAIRDINNPPPIYFEWRDLEKSDWDAFSGVEDMSAQICDIIIDGQFQGIMIAEINYVGVYMNALIDFEDGTSYCRDFQKSGFDAFIADNRLGYSFADWAIAKMQEKSFGVDDIRDILGMTSH